MVIEKYLIWSVKTLSYGFDEISTRDMWYHVIPRAEEQKYKDLVENYDNLGLSYCQSRRKRGDITNLKLITRCEYQLGHINVVAGPDGHPFAEKATQQHLDAVEKLPTLPHGLIKDSQFYSYQSHDTDESFVFWADEEDVKELIPFMDMDNPTVFIYNGISCLLEAGRGNKWHLRTSDNGDAILKMLIRFADGALKPYTW